MEQQSFIPKCNFSYDIFLSFRGEDTRHTFTGHLLNAFHNRGINIFFDDKDLKVGDDMSPTLLKAIEESRMSIIVFSENYASSTWCLDELVKIVECKEKNNQCVWPIFYKIDPGDVRHQSMEGLYGKAMAQHESRFGKNSERILKWRSTLTKVANLSGDHLIITGHEYEYEFIDKILKKASLILPSKGLHVERHVVGVKSRLEEVMSILDMQSKSTICMLGIHGTGGIGKTTLVKILYNSLVREFEYATFLSDVRKKSLTDLQQRLLSQILGLDYFKFDDVDEGAFELKNRLCNRRVLLILDDVDSSEQLEKLVGECNWFGSGSRIIVTTRNKHLLIAHRVDKIYKMKELNVCEASELFCWNSFNSSQPPKGFEGLSKEVINYAKGLPLALKVIGSNLSKKDLVECQCALEQYKKIPDPKIQSKLRVSYDGLSKNEKKIFLDIACFFKGYSLEDVNNIFDANGFGPKYHIKVLVDKSLINIDEWGRIEMHDLIQSMGQEVIKAAAPERLGEQSRLWSCEDVVKVLQENSGTYKVEGIILESPESEIQWIGTAFKKMKNLRILIIRNAQFSIGPMYLPSTLTVLEWEGYPSTSLPSNFDPKKLVVFKMPHSCLNSKILFKKLEYLSILDFSYCQFITEVSDISGAPNVKKLEFDQCRNLVKVHDSIGFLKKAIYLSFESCQNLTRLPRVLQMPSLETLKINNCSSLQRFPGILGNMRLQILARNIGAKEMPDSSGELTGLYELELSGSSIVSHPISIELLSCLRLLFVVSCGTPSNFSSIYGRSDTWSKEYFIPAYSQLGDHGYTILHIKRADTLPPRYKHRCKGGFLLFWVRNNFPSVQFAFIKENYMKNDTRSAVKFQLFINKVEVTDMFMLDSNGCKEPLMYRLSLEFRKYLNTYLVINECNYVEFKVTEDPHFSSHNTVIKECGVRVRNVHKRKPERICKIQVSETNHAEKRCRGFRDMIRDMSRRRHS